MAVPIMAPALPPAKPPAIVRPSSPSNDDKKPELASCHSPSLALTANAPLSSLNTTFSLPYVRSR